jgi:hypothetical protein
MATIRFSRLVELAGKPTVHLLWIDPTKDKTLQKAISDHRVLTVHQRPVDAKSDYGTVGFQEGVSGQILIFPKSLKQFAEKRVIGVKYGLLEWPTVPVSQQVRKTKQVQEAKPAQRSSKSKRQKAKTKLPIRKAEPPAVEEIGTGRVVKFPTPAGDDEIGSSPDVETIKSQVRQAMKFLEEGKQVATFNLLKRIVDG